VKALEQDEDFIGMVHVDADAVVRDLEDPFLAGHNHSVTSLNACDGTECFRPRLSFTVTELPHRWTTPYGHEER
jgi:hypothetical protein